MKSKYTVGSFISPFNSCLKLKGAGSLHQNSLEIDFKAAFGPMENYCF